MSSYPPSQPIEIIVTASRIPNAIQFPTIGSFHQNWESYPSGQRDNEWLYGPFSDLLIDDTPPNHLKRQLIDSIISNYLEYYAELRNQIGFISDFAIIMVGLGKSITGQELRSKLNGMQTQITDQTYLPGYAGANHGDRFEINWQQLGGYIAPYGQEAVNYLIFHEIAHNTEAGLISRSWMINSHQDALAQGIIPSGSKYDSSSMYFQRQEAYANTTARMIADAVGISITPPNSGSNWPPNGYETY